MSTAASRENSTLKGLEEKHYGADNWAELQGIIIIDVMGRTGNYKQTCKQECS